MALIFAHFIYGAIILWLGRRNRELAKLVKSIASLPAAVPSFDRLTLPPAPPLRAPEIPPDFCVNTNDAPSVLQQCFAPLANTTKEYIIEVVDIVEVPVRTSYVGKAVLTLLLLGLAVLVYCDYKMPAQQRRALQNTTCEDCVTMVVLSEQQKEEYETKLVNMEHELGIARRDLRLMERRVNDRQPAVEPSMISKAELEKAKVETFAEKAAEATKADAKEKELRNTIARQKADLAKQIKTLENVKDNFEKASTRVTDLQTDIQILRQLSTSDQLQIAELTKTKDDTQAKNVTLKHRVAELESHEKEQQEKLDAVTKHIEELQSSAKISDDESRVIQELKQKNEELQAQNESLGQQYDILRPAFASEGVDIHPTEPFTRKAFPDDTLVGDTRDRSASHNGKPEPASLILKVPHRSGYSSSATQEASGNDEDKKSEHERLKGDTESLKDDQSSENDDDNDADADGHSDADPAQRGPGFDEAASGDMPAQTSNEAPQSASRSSPMTVTARGEDATHEQDEIVNPTGSTTPTKGNTVAPGSPTPTKVSRLPRLSPTHYRSKSTASNSSGAQSTVTVLNVAAGDFTPSTATTIAQSQAPQAPSNGTKPEAGPQTIQRIPEHLALFDELGISLPLFVNDAKNIPDRYFELKRGPESRVRQWNRNLMRTYNKQRGRYENKERLSVHTKLEWRADNAHDPACVNHHVGFRQENLLNPSLSRTIPYEDYLREKNIPPFATESATSNSQNIPTGPAAMRSSLSQRMGPNSANRSTSVPNVSANPGYQQRGSSGIAANWQSGLGHQPTNTFGMPSNPQPNSTFQFTGGYSPISVASPGFGFGLPPVSSYQSRPVFNFEQSVPSLPSRDNTSQFQFGQAGDFGQHSSSSQGLRTDFIRQGSNASSQNSSTYVQTPSTPTYTPLSTSGEQTRSGYRGRGRGFQQSSQGGGRGSSNNSGYR